MRVGIGQQQVRHMHAVAQLVDRNVEIVLRDGACLGQRLGIVEINLAQTEHRHINMRTRNGFRALDKLHHRITRYREVLTIQPLSAIFIGKVLGEEGLCHTRVAVLCFFGERLC